MQRRIDRNGIDRNRELAREGIWLEIGIGNGRRPSEQRLRVGKTAIRNKAHKP